jgi:hypothetical protein
MDVVWSRFQQPLTTGNHGTPSESELRRDGIDDGTAVISRISSLTAASALCCALSSSPKPQHPGLTQSKWRRVLWYARATATVAMQATTTIEVMLSNRYLNLAMLKDIRIGSISKDKVYY